MARESDRVPTLLQRSLGRVIDFLIVYSLMVALSGLSTQGEDGVFELPRWVPLVVAWAYVIYETVGVMKYGKTVGKKFTNTEVVALADGSRPALIQALLRALVPATALVILPLYGPFVAGAIYLTALLDQDSGRGIPDKAAGTVVVVERPNSPDGDWAD